MGIPHAEVLIRKALYKHIGTQKLTKICEFYYHTDTKIYVICQKGGFVVCPREFTRGKVVRDVEGYLIWKLDLASSKENLGKLKSALSAMKRAPFKEHTLVTYDGDFKD